MNTSIFNNYRAQKTKHKHQTPLPNKHLREEDPEYAKRSVETSDTRKFDISSGSEDEAPDFDYLLKLPSSSGSHFILKSEKEKFEDDSSQFSKHFVIDTNILNLAMKSIPFNERHDIPGIEWSSAEILQMGEEAQANEKTYRDAIEKKVHEKNRQIDEKSEKLGEKFESLKVSENKTAKIASKTPANDKEAIQDWLDDILDL